MINMKDLLLGATMRAAHIPRYSAIPVNHRESVAEHSFFVAIYADRLAVDMGLNDIFPQILKAALWHDIEETWTGDFIRSFKYSDPDLKSKMDDAARHCAYKVFDEILQNPVFAEMAIGIWNDAKSDNVIGKVVKFADFLSVVSYVSKETAMGNKYAQKMMEYAIPPYLDTFFSKPYSELWTYATQVDEIIHGGWKDVRACI